MIKAYPLQWPIGQKRTERPQDSRFQVTPNQAYEDLIEELRLLGATNIVVSSNVETYERGGRQIPYKNQNVQDTGVAVYFTKNNDQMCIACDRWLKVFHNVRAIGLTVQALRGLERWGTSDMVSQAFAGFAQIPAQANSGSGWWVELGLDSPGYSLEDCERAYRKQAKNAHPDLGGTAAQMARLNEAIASARQIKA
jgi:hypothetical protein